jgi:hypothetical protein
MIQIVIRAGANSLPSSLPTIPSLSTQNLIQLLFRSNRTICNRSYRLNSTELFCAHILFTVFKQKRDDMKPARNQLENLICSYRVCMLKRHKPHGCLRETSFEPSVEPFVVTCRYAIKFYVLNRRFAAVIKLNALMQLCIIKFILYFSENCSREQHVALARSTPIPIVFAHRNTATKLNFN